MKKNRFIAIVFLSLILNAGLAQSDSYNDLVRAAKEECRTNSYVKNCSKYDKTIEEKFRVAAVYLREELSLRMVCKNEDSCDNAEYNAKLKQLKKKRGFNIGILFGVFIKKGAEDMDTPGSESILSDEEKLCLLVSVMKPSKSHYAFNKLFQSYYRLPDSFTISEDSGTYYYYRMWLYELLRENFQKEPAFPQNQAAIVYNKAIALAETDFKDLETEKKLFSTIEELLRNALALNPKLADNDKAAEMFGMRGWKMSEYFYQKPSADLEKYIEEIFSKALALSPDNRRVNYNFGAFYYNRAVHIAEDMDSKRMQTDSQMKEMEELFKKAKPYLEKGKKQQAKAQ